MTNVRQLLEENGFPVEIIKFKFPDKLFSCSAELLEIKYINNSGYTVHPILQNKNSCSKKILENNDKFFECYPQIMDVKVNFEKCNNINSKELAMIIFRNILYHNEKYNLDEIDEICSFVKLRNKIFYIKNKDNILSLQKSITNVRNAIHEFNSDIEGMDSHSINKYAMVLITLIKNEMNYDLKIIKNLHN